MNSIKDYFQSPIKVDTMVKKNATPKVLTENNVNSEDSLIIKNMKSVIKAGKSKRKKSIKPSESNDEQITEIADVLTTNLCFVSPNKDFTETNNISVNSSTLPISTEIFDEQLEFLDVIQPEIVIEETPPNEFECNVNENVIAKKNVFQILMNARHKTIGSSQSQTNTNSQDLDTSQEKVAESSAQIKVKRKLNLEKWAESKGAIKKRLEKSDEECIKLKMEQRAIKLKNMLTRGGKITKSKGKPRLNSFIVDDISTGGIDNNFSEEDITKSKTKKRIKRMRSDSLDEVVVDKPTDDTEFLDKLSSPLKGKDSVLGFFPIIGKSPSNEIVQIPVENVKIHKKRGRKKKVKVNDLTDSFISTTPEDPTSCIGVDPIIANEPQAEPTVTASGGRPKRACAMAIKNYKSLLDPSPEKEYDELRSRGNMSPTIMKSKKPKRCSSSTANELIIIDCDSNESPKSPKKARKLAPLFIKALPKPVIDPEILRARQEFLQSGIPEVLRSEIDRQKSYEDNFEMNLSLFPTISHVHQKVTNNGISDENSENFTEEIIRICSFRNETTSSNEECEFRSIKLLNENQNIVKNNEKSMKDYCKRSQLPKSVLAETLKQLKQETSHFPVYRCFKQLKSKYNEAIQQETSNNFLFTDKYGPTCLNDFITNKFPVENLKKYLSNWTENKMARNGDVETDDDFENTNDSTTSSISNVSNAIVLYGPCGSGKTSAVFALANEMNFRILEINAGAKRTGKKLLQELQEATQSHAVRRGAGANKDGLGIFDSRFISSQDSQNSNNTGSGDDNESKKLALILIEDADIVFDQDFGFVDAINQLILISKRPVILVTNDPNCPHLMKLIAQNSIEFNTPTPTTFAKWLTVMSLAENVYADTEELKNLLNFNGNDVRRTIFQLQFYVLSGGDGVIDDTRKSSTNEKLKTRKSLNRKSSEKKSIDCDDDSRLSWIDDEKPDKLKPIHKHNEMFRFFSRESNSTDQLLPSPINFNTLWLNTRQILSEHFSGTKKPIHGNMMNDIPVPFDEDLLEYYDNISTALIFNEKSTDDRISSTLTENMVQSLCNGAINLCNPTFVRDNYDQLKNYNYTNVNNLYDHLTTGGTALQTPIVNLDYEPFLRSICRIERDRKSNDRKANRFYHYLRNCVNFNSFSKEIFHSYSIIFDDEFRGKQNGFCANIN